MDMNEYQELALRTMSKDTTLTVAALGLAGESGEVCDLLKKSLAQGHTLNAAQLQAELGDILWYVAIAAHFLGVPLKEIAQGNVDKLHDRYMNGFNAEASTSRYVDGLIEKNNPYGLSIALMNHDEVGSPALD